MWPHKCKAVHVGWSLEFVVIREEPLSTKALLSIPDWQGGRDDMIGSFFFF